MTAVLSAQATDSGPLSLFGVDPTTYRRSPLHDPERTYPETNCYADLLIELLHAHGDEPLAGLSCVLGLAFEGDQFTFFKPEPAALRTLYGLDIHEIQLYRPLVDVAGEQLAAGKAVLVEVDGFFLPDTAATSYRREHVKTSCAMDAIDVAGERLRYFHNAGRFELEGEDFRGIFRLGRAFSDDVLPPYTELVRFDAGPRLEGEALRTAALALLRGHLARRPATNPFPRFAIQLADALPELLAGSAAQYHDYAFATARMFGAAFEVCAGHVAWLLGDAGEPAVGSLRELVDGAKVLSFRLARRKPFDPEPIVASLAVAWDDAQRVLDDVVA